MQVPNFTDSFVSSIHGVQMCTKLPWSQMVHRVFPCLHFPTLQSWPLCFWVLYCEEALLWQQWLSKLGGFFSSLYFFLNPCDLFLALIFFIGLLSPKSWTPASMLCSCLYCCIPSQGMGVEDAVFSVVGKWRPAILECFHGYTSSSFYSNWPSILKAWQDEVMKCGLGMRLWCMMWFCMCQ